MLAKYTREVLPDLLACHGQMVSKERQVQLKCMIEAGLGFGDIHHFNLAMLAFNRLPACS